MKSRAQSLEVSISRMELSDRQILEEDEKCVFPSEIERFLDDENILMTMVPAELGGELTNIQGLLDIVRVLSYRNLTCAIAIGQTMLGSIPVWIAGSIEQKKQLTSLLSEGHLNCLALTEESFGSDLLSNQVSITGDGEHQFRLTGEKWCINNATHGRMMTVLVKSHPMGGERGYSLLFVDKEKLENKSFVNRGKLQTLGLRGADISGIKFTNTSVHKDALLGAQGKGLDIVYKTMQVSRTLCSGFSLGAGERCLRMVYDFSSERKLYGANILAIENVKANLINAYAKLLFCDGVATVFARACTMIPEQMSVYSSVGKTIIPAVVDCLILQCQSILGARSYLCEGKYGLFQKMKRDHGVVSLFDGSSEVNLFLISSQLRNLFGDKVRKASYDVQWADLYDISVKAVDFDACGFKLSNRGRDFIWDGMDILSQKGDSEINHLVENLVDEYKTLSKTYESIKLFDQRSEVSFRLSREYSLLISKAAYLQFWFYNKRNFPLPFMKTLSWLEYILTIDTNRSVISEELPDSASVYDSLSEQAHNNLSFSHQYFECSKI